MSLKRREFLKYLGLATASTAGAGWLLRSVSISGQNDVVGIPGIDGAGAGAERWVPSICQLCRGGCGIRVRLVDGVPVRIEGNPLFPINRGGLCPAGQAGLHVLRSPDRIKSPLKRVGERGSNRWQAISWDIAMETIAEKLRSLRASGLAHKVVFLDGAAQGLLKEVFQNFLIAYGSPNYIDAAPSRSDMLPFLLTEGLSEPPVFDLANTNYLLSFGYDFLEAEAAPVWNSRAYAGLHERKTGARGKLVVVDPRFSITAAKADKWIPITPGTEGALALGIAYVLIQEELYDSSFVRQYAEGFEDFQDRQRNAHSGFRSFVLKNYYPEAVSAITGVPIEDIFRVARGFAAQQPGLAVCGERAHAHTNGLYTQLAVQSLNALVGNLERPGGILQSTKPPLARLPKPQPDKVASFCLTQPRIDDAGTPLFPLVKDVPSKVPQNILRDHPYAVEVLFLYSTNPILRSPKSLLWRQSLEKVPLVVAIGTVLNESIAMADIVLPEHTYLERWGEVFEAPNARFPHFGLQRPVVEPAHDTKHAGDIAIALAGRIGPPLTDVFPSGDYLSVLKHAAYGIFKSGRGAIVAGPFEEAMMEYLKERGWRYPGHKSFDDFWKSLGESGGWFDAASTPKPLRLAFDTPSRKFEFIPQRLSQVLKIRSSGDEACLPHYEEPKFEGNKSQFSFFLVPFQVNVLMNDEATNSPAMMEMSGFRNYRQWDSWVEINPESAATLGIREGDSVWVESMFGKVRTNARIFAAAMPGVVSMPTGMGRTVGRFARGYGVNPMELLAPLLDPLSGIAALLSTRVKVYKA